MILLDNSGKISTRTYQRRVNILPTFRTVPVPGLGSIGIRPNCWLRHIWPFVIGDDVKVTLRIESLLKDDNKLEFIWGLSRHEGVQYRRDVAGGSSFVICKQGVNETPFNMPFLALSGNYDLQARIIFGEKVRSDLVVLAQFHLIDKDRALLNIYSAIFGGIVGALLTLLIITITK